MKSRFKRNNLPVKSNKPVSNNNGKNGNGNGNGNGKLTFKQSRFVDEYLIDFNATQSAIRAGYSPRSAEIAGFQNIRKYKIIEAIQKRRNELKISSGITPEWVLDNYKKLVDYDLDEIYDDEGILKPLSEISKNAKYGINGFKNMKNVTTKKTAKGTESFSETIVQDLKFSDKKPALDSISRCLGMFAKDNEQKNRPGGSSVAIVGQTIQVNLVEAD